MSIVRLRIRHALPLIAIVAAAAPASGEGAPRRTAFGGFVEAGGGYDRLTDGEPSWNDEYVRAHLRLTEPDSVDLEVTHQAHFDDRGTYFGAGYTRILSDRWHASLHVGGSDRGFFLPRYNFHAAAYRKWLTRRNLVTSLAFAYSRARDAHFDRTAALNATYYFDAPWIVEGGVRLNDSNPGNVLSARGYVAATHGRDKRRYVTLRYESGRESYQLIAPGQAVTDFSSSEISLVWRQWLSGPAGFNARAVWYTNPTYERWGGALGLFWEF